MRSLGVAMGALLVLAFFLFTRAPAMGATTPSITISPHAAVVGSRLSISGEGYPPSTQLTLEWSSVNASWQVSGNPPQVRGVSAVPVQDRLASVETDASGSFSTAVSVPSDYGGQHVIQAAFPNGTVITGRAIFILEPSFNISPTSGPAGSPITVTAMGLGYGEYSTSYHLYWDNSYVGYFTAISTHGATNFTVYASGAPGTHYLQVYQGYPGPAYLNPQQGPPSSETQSNFPPYIPFNTEFNITGSQTGGGLAPSGAMGVASLVALAAALTAGGLVVVVRSKPEQRGKAAKSIAALIIIAAVVAAGVSVYLVFAPGSATQSASYTPQEVVVRPAIVAPQNTATNGPRITITPDVAVVGQTVTVNGAGFAPSSQIPLSWSTRKGSNVLGYQQVYDPLRNVTTDSSGAFSFSMMVPADLGGLHYISASSFIHSNGSLFLERTASVNATEGPAGTVVAVTMTGVGWTFNTNIAALDYDNSYIGYGCGFNSGGNVTFYLTVTGAPGIHTIDIYPSIWWGTSNYYNQSVVEYRYPLLTPQDHPGLMPSFHFSFLITPSSQSPSAGNSLAYVSSPGVAIITMVGVSSPAFARNVEIVNQAGRSR